MLQLICLALKCHGQIAQKCRASQWKLWHPSLCACMCVCTCVCFCYDPHWTTLISRSIINQGQIINQLIPSTLRNTNARTRLSCVWIKHRSDSKKNTQHGEPLVSSSLTFNTRIPVAAPGPLRLPRPAVRSSPAGWTTLSGCLSMQAPFPPTSPPFLLVPVWVLLVEATTAAFTSSSSIAMSRPSHQQRPRARAVLRVRDWQIPAEQRGLVRSRCSAAMSTETVSAVRRAWESRSIHMTGAGSGACPAAAAPFSPRRIHVNVWWESSVHHGDITTGHRRVCLWPIRRSISVKGIVHPERNTHSLTRHHYADDGGCEVFESRETLRGKQRCSQIQ